jgi:hypothetical protein
MAAPLAAAASTIATNLKTIAGIDMIVRSLGHGGIVHAEDAE